MSSLERFIPMLGFRGRIIVSDTQLLVVERSYFTIVFTISLKYASLQIVFMREYKEFLAINPV